MPPSNNNKSPQKPPPSCLLKNQTITPTKEQRRQTKLAEGLSPQKSTTAKQKMKKKIIYLIRHGESIAQCTKNTADRRINQNLLDCSLSIKGIEQAKELGKNLPENIELVVSSPLTRALQTSCIAFSNHNIPILCHYHLREIGSIIPENIPRNINTVIKDLKEIHGISESTIQNIDVQTLQPENWPKRHVDIPKVIRRDAILHAINYLLTERDEEHIAVVCHYHVIRVILQNDKDVKPQNCQVIPCQICSKTGQLIRII